MKLIPMNTESSAFRLKQAWASCLPTVLVKGCVPVSTFSSPDVDGGSSLSLCEALTQLFWWHMPLEVRLGETGHEAVLGGEHSACSLTVLEERLESSLYFGSWGATIIWSAITRLSALPVLHPGHRTES